MAVVITSTSKVVVDTFAETRENDVVNLAQEMEFSMEDDQQILKQIFRRTGVIVQPILTCFAPTEGLFGLSGEHVFS